MNLQGNHQPLNEVDSTRMSQTSCSFSWQICVLCCLLLHLSVVSSFSICHQSFSRLHRNVLGCDSRESFWKGQSLILRDSFNVDGNTGKIQQKNQEYTTTSLDLLAKLKRDLATLTALKPPQPSADESIQPAIVSAGSSYTRIWTHSTWKVQSDPPHRRYVRHILRWHKSTTARKVLPTVVLACLWSVVVSLLTKYCATADVRYTVMIPVQKLLTSAASSTSPAFSFLSAPLALLLTLRANASMARLLEARQAWGRLVSCFYFFSFSNQSDSLHAT